MDRHNAPAPARVTTELTPELIQEIALDRSPAVSRMGVRLHAMDGRSVTFRLDWQEALVGDPESGSLMGGVITTLIDHASGLSVALATRSQRFPEATLELRIDYLKPSRRGSAVCVKAECHKVTRRIAFVRATAWHADNIDDVIATGVATFMMQEAAGGST
jgi:uncharacterized protein (TIGR00369 family)